MMKRENCDEDGVYQRVIVDCGRAEYTHVHTNLLQNQSKSLILESKSSHCHLLEKPCVLLSCKMGTKAKVEDWPGKAGVKMVTLTSSSLQVS